ncbi:MAG: signal peptidase I [Planctomycetota bacterium]|jgi:signal peptidase I
MPEDSTKTENAPEGKNLRAWADFLFREWVRPIAIIVIIACSFRSAIADWNDVPTGSMKPTILEGDRILVNKLAYDLKIPFTSHRLIDWGTPARGEIIVFFSPDSSVRMVKRVVGVPGDEIAMYENRLYVNGEPAGYVPLDDETVNQIEASDQHKHQFAFEVVGGAQHPVMLTPGMRARRSFSPIVIPEGQYFAMGDNRDNSRDSRWFGFVPRELIVGRVSRVAISLDPEHWRIPRWDRFFRELP